MQAPGNDVSSQGPPRTPTGSAAFGPQAALHVLGGIGTALGTVPSSMCTGSTSAFTGLPTTTVPSLPEPMGKGRLRANLRWRHSKQMASANKQATSSVRPTTVARSAPRSDREASLVRLWAARSSPKASRDLLCASCSSARAAFVSSCLVSSSSRLSRCCRSCSRVTPWAALTAQSSSRTEPSSAMATARLSSMASRDRLAASSSAAILRLSSTFSARRCKAAARSALASAASCSAASCTSRAAASSAGCPPRVLLSLATCSLASWTCCRAAASRSLAWASEAWAFASCDCTSSFWLATAANRS
mmetsp:Transcript_87994/g.284880  ORF Transcript_87994/g.284880 Transcript_87994/m.284880 type:complete len:304 (+) Transcript_87994:353-1264(+)